jgi:hypothetical protein
LAFRGASLTAIIRSAEEPNYVAVEKTRLTDWIEVMDQESLDSIGKALQQV